MPKEKKESNDDNCNLVLRCTNGSQEDVLLKNGIPLILGRGPLTGIKDKKLSKNQVKLTANYERKVVLVQQLGANPSKVCGKRLHQKSEYELKDGDVICLLYDQYSYVCKLIDSTSSLNNSASADITTEEAAASEVSSCALRIGATEKKTIKDYFCTTQREEQGTAEEQGIKRKREEEEEIVEEDQEEEARVGEAAEQLEEMRRLLKRRDPPSASGMKRSTSLPFSPPNGSSLMMTKFGLPRPPGDTWDFQKKLIAYTCKGSIPREKIAGFDVDWTIIGTKTGKVFPAGPDDWRLLFPEVLSKLRQLFEDDYKIVFFTNQRGFSKDSPQFKNFKQKIRNVITKIGVPVQVFISTGSGIFRKPAPGMWEYLEEVGNEGLSIDIGSSFFVGDAAGRPANSFPGKKKKDFACGDRLFALNLGLTFYTPEEFFLGHKQAPFILPDFDPRKLDSNVDLCSPSDSEVTSKKQEVIIMVGYPASGKSTFVLHHLVPKGYVHVNRDLLGTWQKCVSATQDALKAGKCVVIDNTNPDVATRNRYIECARMVGVPCRCFVMAVTLDHAKHNNKFRHISGRDEAHEHVNDITLNAFKTKYEAPKVMEGYKEIVTINFVPKFKSEKLERLYHMFIV